VGLSLKQLVPKAQQYQTKGIHMKIVSSIIVTLATVSAFANPVAAPAHKATTTTPVAASATTTTTTETAAAPATTTPVKKAKKKAAAAAEVKTETAPAAPATKTTH